MGTGRVPERLPCSACFAVAFCTTILTIVSRTQDIDSEVAPDRSANLGVLYHVHHGSPLSRSPEYIMSTHPSPDDVCFTRGDLAPILEGRPPVGGPRHLEDAGGPLHALHPKTRSKRSRFEVRYELCDRRQKSCLLVSRKRIEVGAEAGQPGKGGHALSASAPGPPWSFCPTPQGRKELLAGAEYFQTIAGKIGIRFPLPLLPLLRPKPRLGGVDDLLRPEQNPLVRDLGIQEIAFFEMRSGADLLGKSQLSFGSQRGSRHDHSLADVPNIG